MFRTSEFSPLKHSETYTETSPLCQGLKLWLLAVEVDQIFYLSSPLNVRLHLDLITNSFQSLKVSEIIFCLWSYLPTASSLPPLSRAHSQLAAATGDLPTILSPCQGCKGDHSTITTFPGTSALGLLCGWDCARKLTQSTAVRRPLEQRQKMKPPEQAQLWEKEGGLWKVQQKAPGAPTASSCCFACCPSLQPYTSLFAVSPELGRGNVGCVCVCVAGAKGENSLDLL